MATLNPALRAFWRAPARIRTLYGGRSSSKSWDAAGNTIALAQCCKLRILCTRQFQNRIEESVYSLLKIRIAEFGLQNDFIILQNKIIHRYTGTEFIFYGMWRNFEEIKSLEGIDICWIEEARFLTAEQWRDLEPTIRKQGSQIWVLFNPGLVSDFAWKRFVVNPPPNSIVRRINYDENPFLSDTMRGIITAAYAEDPDEADHVYGGEPRTDDDRVVIQRSWILAAIDAHERLGLDVSGQERIAYDVADDGADMNATIGATGILAHTAVEWKGQTDDLLGSCTQVYDAAKPLQAHIVYDSIGVGAACGSKFRELNDSTGARIGYTAFNAGGKVDDPDGEYQPGKLNKDQFANIKAQTWWTVADRFRNTYDAVHNGAIFDPAELIAIDSRMDRLEQLIDELSTPRRHFDGAGKVKVESKEDLIKRGVKSPNLADAFVMAYSPPALSVLDYSKIL